MAKDQKGREVKSGRLGDCTVVVNQNRHHAANARYFSFRAQFDGDIEVSLLFTENELRRARNRALKNPEDVPDVPFLMDLFD